MSVAKPVLEYIAGIKVEANFRQSLKGFRTLLKYHKRYIPSFAVVIVLCYIRSYLSILEPLYTAQIIDKVITQGQTDLLLGLVLSIFYAIVGYAVVNFAVLFLNGFNAQLMTKDIRNDYYKSLQQKSFGFFDRAAVGDLLSRATMDLQSVEGFLRTWISSIFDAIFTVINVFIVIFAISPTMSFITLLPLPFVFYITVNRFVKIRPMFRKMLLILGRLGAYIQQNIIGMKNVRIFQREKELADGFLKAETVYVDTAISVGRIEAKYTPSSTAILTLGMIIIYVYGTSLVISPSSMLTIGELTLFVRYMMRLTMPLTTLSQLFGSWINTSAALERIREIINVPVEVRDESEAKEIPIEKGEIEFRDVNFEYVKDRPILKNINFKVGAGEKIAILGATGSGKTTLVYLVPRFYDVRTGSISIDGTDVRHFKLSSLRGQIGLVLQDVFLFTGTLRDNIAFGKPDASMEEVISVAKLARIHDFIESLPEGYSSMVGERGVTLSGGQKQRITIARALIVNPKILILDDSLSFVDAKTEQEIQQAIEEAMKGRTTFIIAQRLSTIKNADRILVLSNGEIVELGTHSELMAKDGIYKRIYETQFLEKAPEEILRAEVR
jgi:ABC-type multidrug transport system fused ATPase/permease subunit